jgi:5-methylcytosine-specific restriction protein A
MRFHPTSVSYFVRSTCQRANTQPETAVITEAEIHGVRGTVYNAIGVEVKARVDASQSRQGLLIWFSNYTRQGGPLFEIRPSGLKRHTVSLSFGSYARECIEHIKARANEEHYSTARAFLDNLGERYDLSLGVGEAVGSWTVTDQSRVEVTVKNIDALHDTEQIKSTVNSVMVPLMAAMAELIGYEPKELSNSEEVEGAEDGAISYTVVKRRERNPRNRILCLAIHGEKCAVCGLDPKDVYGSQFGLILEVHHIEPLSEADSPKIYNPATDLVPLCPNCHRAIHKRTPALLPEELKQQMAS